MKKLFYTAVASLPAVALATDPASNAQAYEGSVAQQIVTDASGTITNFLTGAGGVIATVLVAGLAITVGIALAGLIMKAFNRGKGR